MSRYDTMAPVSRQDKDHEVEAALYAAERLDDYAAARSRCGTCGECGGSDGMRAYDREAAGWFIWGNTPPAFYLWHADPHHLYAICKDCNPGGQVPNGYERMNRGQVIVWMAKRCDCPACMLDRGDIPITGGRA